MVSCSTPAPALIEIVATARVIVLIAAYIVGIDYRSGEKRFTKKVFPRQNLQSTEQRSFLKSFVEKIEAEPLDNYYQKE